MLGAQGVQMGTHFVVTNESQVHENYKDMIIKARDIDSSGHRTIHRTSGKGPEKSDDQRVLTERAGGRFF